MRALDGLTAKRAETEVRPWLFTIMHNLFVSQMRKTRVSGHHRALDEFDESAFATRARQEDHLRWHEMVRALDSLPQEQRTVVLLAAVESLPYAQIARVLGIPIGTVMSRLARARERLRAMTQGDEARPPLRRVK